MIRGFIPLLILACLQAISANELNCVENTLTAAQKCGNYYLCVYGENILKECPDNLHFNAQTKQCDSPINANCQLNTRPYTGCKAINLGEAEFAPHNDCGKYYVCQGIIKTEMPCPSGLHFNPSLNVCDWPDRVNCEGVPETTEEITTEKVTTESEVSTEAEITTEGGVSKPNENCRANNPGEAVFAPHDDCGKFYYCLGTGLVEMSCPSGLHFNPSINVCDWPENSGCKGTTGSTEAPETEAPETEAPETEAPETEAPETAAPETEAPGTEAPEIETEAPTNNSTGKCRANNPGEAEFAPHPDCGKYYVCQGALLTEMSCPAGLHFNPALNVCDWPQNVNCQSTPGPTEEPATEAPETEEPETEAPETEDPETVVPETEVTETDQPETEAPETESPETVGPTTEAEVTNRPTGECRANHLGEAEFAPHPDCGKYYVCQGSSLTEMSCPPGLHFNPALNVCDWPQNANCQGTGSTEEPETEAPETEEPETDTPETEEPTTEVPATEEPETEAPETESPETVGPTTEAEVTNRPTGECRANHLGEAEFAPHPDCGKYYVCQGSSLTEMSCPPGLHFNPALNVCDWPQNANCQGTGATEEPETEAPETEETETDAPETEKPTTEVPATEEPETVAPETELPETEEPPTSAPETEEPETETPEIEEPETEIPNTTEAEVTNKPTGECRANHPGEVEFAPHPDCGKYYVCQGALLTEMNCPTGLHFNPALNVCDWPQNANCQGSSGSSENPETVAPETEEPATEAPETDEPETEGPETESPETEWPGTNRPTGECRANHLGEVEFAPHPDCGKYYVCQGSSLTEMSCPPGLHFNPALNFCDWPQNVNCQSTGATAEPETEVPETEKPETEVPETEEPETEAPETGVTETEVPETEEPKTEEPETEAPETEVTETEIPETEEPETNAPETEEPETESPEPEVPTSTEAEVTNKPTGECRANHPWEVEFAPHSDCGKYFVCQGSSLTEMSCPPGLHFNPALNVCDWPQNANCQGTGATEEPETEAPETEEPETVVPETEEPETDAPETVEPETESPETEEPETEVSSTTEEEVTNKPTGECRANHLGEVEFAPHPDCGKYYVCQGTLLTEMNCPPGLHFNPALNVCDWPQNANCQGTPGSTEKPETEEPETEEPETVAPETEEPETEIPTTTEAEVTNKPTGECRANHLGEVEFAPHPDCGKYYVCQGTLLTEMNCPAGLHFNPRLNVCDWPQYANCQGSSNSTEGPETPEPETAPTEEPITTEEPVATDDPTTNIPNPRQCRANNIGEVEFAPHPTDCKKYYVCYWDRLIEMNCPFDLYFNAVLNVCDSHNDAKCNSNRRNIV